MEGDFVYWGNYKDVPFTVPEPACWMCKVHVNYDIFNIIVTTILVHQFERNKKSTDPPAFACCAQGMLCDLLWQLPGHSALTSVLARACNNLIGTWFNCITPEKPCLVLCMLLFHSFTVSFPCFHWIHSLFLLYYGCFQSYAQEPQAPFTTAFH